MTSAGFFIAFEGGEGAGKSTQVARLAESLRQIGHDVVTTFEPGDTPVGRRLREILLGHDTGRLDPRTEALLYAADRSEHVARVVRPTLASGAVCITDRYIDSSLAYQGAGRTLDDADVETLSRWAADGLMPDLTVLLDIDPAVGLTRFASPADRLEAEPIEFHQRVREQFLRLCAREPQRYLVVDATEPSDVVAERIVTDVVKRLS